MRVDVLTSGIWQTTSTILSHDGACLVADPAYFPRELDAIAARVGELGRAEAVIFTHGHWDHVMGHAIFPGAPVKVSAALADAVARGEPHTVRYLEAAREFDSRWYVPRPHGHRWPATMEGVAPGPTTIAGIALRALHLPGHSPDGLGLLVEAEGLLLVGDYLSPCEIPFVDDVVAYQATLRSLLALLDGAVARVIPGHGPPMSAAEAATIARADLAYLERLVAAPDPMAVPLPRAADVVGMLDHHRENVVAISPGR
jgi:glyoxylase-like metal-dependent hydrolase (beta-lactamase superfamily II)